MTDTTRVRRSVFRVRTLVRVRVRRSVNTSLDYRFNKATVSVVSEEKTASDTRQTQSGRAFEDYRVRVSVVSYRPLKK